MRVCPDYSGMDDFYEIRNGYSNKTLRTSFAFEIIKTPCTNTTEQEGIDDCPSNKDV